MGREPNSWSNKIQALSPFCEVDKIKGYELNYYEIRQSIHISLKVINTSILLLIVSSVIL